MWHALVSAEIASNKHAFDRLKSRLRVPGFELITMSRCLPELVSSIDTSAPEELFFADCVQRLKSSTTALQGITDTLSRIDYLCVGREEYYRTWQHPFMKRYLLPVLHDETEGQLRILAWNVHTKEWEEQQAHAIS